MKHYWEILKTFEEGKNLEYDGEIWNINEDDIVAFIEHLANTEPEEWQIVKSDYEKARLLVDSSLPELRLEVMKEIAKLMVKFKNGEV